MPISFNEVPNGIRTPFLYAEFDNSNAVRGAGVQPYKALFIGQKTITGTKAAEVKEIVTSAAQAAEYFGPGSQLERMASKYFEGNKVNELHCIALDDNAAGVISTGSVTIGGSATVAGIIKLYIAGQKVEIAVATTDTAAELAEDLTIAINNISTVPVAASVDGVIAEKINITAKNKGESDNGIDLRVNYFSGDVLPVGITATVVAMSGGAGNPDIQDAINVMGEDQYMIIVSPYSDAANLTAMEAELSDRFGPIRQNDGYHIVGHRGTISELNTIGNSRNSQFTTIKRCSGPSSPYEHMAAMAASINLAGQIDPARPFQTLELKGILPEPEVDRLIITERNILLNNGIATDYVDAGGLVRIERVITTYKENPAGADDISYLDLNTLLTLSYLRYDFRNFWLKKYPRHKLANDGTQFGQGQAVMTPKVAKAEAILRFKLWEKLGLVENIDQFKEELIVERNAADPNRLDFLLPTDLINQLRVVGVKIGFIL